jgi:site-specific recombinase XerD
MTDKVNIANIDYEAEKALFLRTAGKTDSEQTKLSYGEALRKYEEYAKKNNLNILLMTCGQADDFIYSLDGAPKTKRLTVAAVSSFYSFLERRYSTIKNPVRGTKARPADTTVKDAEIPTDDEVTKILFSLPTLERLAVYIMAYRGLRVGALTNLKVWGRNYQAYSKGKEIRGVFSDGIMWNIKSSTLNVKTPFSGYSTTALKLRVFRKIRKLYEKGNIKFAYSAHDFRHYYAVSEYKRDRDIYKLSKLLDHSNIAITEIT